MKRFILALTALSLLSSCREKQEVSDPDIYALDGPTDTAFYEQAPFEWRITPRHDYSKTYVLKLFMSQAEYDGDYMGKYKMHDNGRQTNYLDCELALEIIKGMDAITLGLPKIVYLVGWQYNGHDSKYPAFFEGNKAIARQGEDPLESIRWLMQEAKNYNTTVSLHINLFDAFQDSPLFDKYVKEDVLAKDKDGQLIKSEWGYKVSYAAEWEKGLLQERIDSLCWLLPIEEAGTIHIDAFHNNVPRPYLVDGQPKVQFDSPISPWHGHTAEQDIEAKKNIIKYLDGKGIDVTTEGVWNMSIGNVTDGYFPMYWHFNSRQHTLSLKASQACGGNVYGVERVFGNNVNGEQLFRTLPDLDEAFPAFKREFCKTTLITQYLNNFERQSLITDQNGNAIGVFEKGVRTMIRDNKMYVAQDGNVLAEGGDIFIPAVWLGNKAVVAFSEDGYSVRTWILPAGTKLPRSTKGWVIQPQGRTEFKDFKVKGRQVTLTLAPGEMVLLTENMKK
ncbi:MAG: hypothetical protein J5661_06245 [Bacteroidaceae bacterium]|nr:hypothetical protein [Bacteroidaceae bacterium]